MRLPSQKTTSGKTFAERSMMIEPGVAQILERQIAQTLDGAVDSAGAGPHFAQ
jgi:hypothetical protein